MAILTDKLAQLSGRERLVLLGGGAAALLLLGYALVWQPWQDELNRLRLQVPAKEADLRWMKEQADRVRPLLRRNGTRRANETPLLTVVEQSARSADLREVIRRMGPGETEHQVRVWLTEADFNRWLGWLEALRDQGVEVVAATVNRGRDNRVTIRATLQRNN